MTESVEVLIRILEQIAALRRLAATEKLGPDISDRMKLLADRVEVRTKLLYTLAVRRSGYDPSEPVI
jgi:hypothetical protein